MKARRRSLRWVVAAIVVIPVGLYHAFFWTLDHPPGSPPRGGDGDWAALGYVIGLPFLLGTVAALGGVVLLASRIGRRDRAQDSERDSADDP